MTLISGRTHVMALVVVHWGNVVDTMRCVDSVLNLESRPDILIVVNNGARVSLNQREMFTLKGITWIDSPTNRGFGSGANIGFERARQLGASYVWFLNNDTVVMPDAFKFLCQSFVDNPYAVAVSSLIFGPDEAVWYSGGTFFLGLARHWTDMRGYKDTESRLVTFLTGCSFIVKIKAIEGVPFRENFFMYGEDADLSLRLSKKGQLYVAPRSMVKHEVSKGLGGSPAYTYYIVRNSVLVAREMTIFWPMAIPILAHRHFKWKRCIALAFLAAISDGLLRRAGISSKFRPDES